VGLDWGAGPDQNQHVLNAVVNDLNEGGKEGASMIQRLAFSVAVVAVTPVLLILVVLSTIYLLSVLLSISGFLG